MTIVCEILVLILWGISVILLYRVLKRMPIFLSAIQSNSDGNSSSVENLYTKYTASVCLMQLCLALLSDGLVCGAWLHILPVARYLAAGAPIVGLIAGLLFGALFNINGKKYGAIKPEEKFFNKISLNGILYGFFYVLELAGFLLIIFAFLG